MITSDFKPYVQEIINFLRSVSIKSSWVADQTNVMLVSKGYAVNLDDPTTWKYYLNLIGEYHPSDTPMSVFSLDTLELIPFTKEGLQHHPRTIVSYYPGTDYFKNLCTQYPDQTDLIKSILFPVNSIQNAISAPDLTLLSWGEVFLEEAEQPLLVAALSKFLDVYRERWFFSFLEVEDYFHPTTLGVLYSLMAAFLLAKRNSFINTPYVHSWHIRNYLQSKGLDDYSDVLSRKKQLFLYQNWDYLKINSGKQSTLIILIKNLLADLGISLFGRRVLMETQTGDAVCQLTPRFIPDNLLGSESRVIEEISAETTLELQQRLYSQGIAASEDTETANALVRKLGDTTANDYLTKFLEIKPVETDYRYQGMLDQFILDTLIKAITTGRYNAVVMITDPLTEATYWVTTKEALALYDYCIRKSNNTDPVALPTSYTYVVALKDRPDPAPQTVVYNGFTYNIHNFLNPDAFLGYWTWPNAIKTKDAFSQLLSEQWILFLVKYQNIEYAYSGALRVAMRHVLSSAIQKNVTETFTLIPNFTTYADWLSGAGIGFQRRIFASYETTTAPQTWYATFADNILGSLFTADTTLRQYGNFALSDNGYTRLRELFTQMCSYTVRFLETNQGAQDYLYLGSFTYDEMDSLNDSPLGLYLALQFLESTTENCIEDQLCLLNKVTLSETEEETITHDIKELSLQISLDVEDTSFDVPPILPMVTEVEEASITNSTLSFGFDLSGFAP